MKQNLPDNPLELFFAVTRGKRSVLIIDSLLSGEKTVEELAKEIPLSSKADIIKQAQELEKLGIVGKILYPSQPQNYKLALTKTGLSLKSVFDEAKKWGSAYKNK